MPRTAATSAVPATGIHPVSPKRMDALSGPRERPCGKTQLRADPRGSRHERAWRTGRSDGSVGRADLRQERGSNVFDTETVLDAFDLIAARRQATGQAPRSEGLFARSNPADRIPPKHYDAIITISEAARLVQVSPGTIRSWIHRGHLSPASSSKPRRVRLRVEYVVKAARERSLPKASATGRRRNRTR